MGHFLIDASLPRSVASAVRSIGHTAVDVRDIGLRNADDRVIASQASAQQMALLTLDHDFGNILDFPPQNYFGIVVFEPHPNATAAEIVAMVEGTLRVTDLINLLTGRLAIVQPGRIRLRPPP